MCISLSVTIEINLNEHLKILIPISNSHYGYFGNFTVFFPSESVTRTDACLNKPFKMSILIYVNCRWCIRGLYCTVQTKGVLLIVIYNHWFLEKTLSSNDILVKTGYWCETGQSQSQRRYWVEGAEWTNQREGKGEERASQGRHILIESDSFN